MVLCLIMHTLGFAQNKTVSSQLVPDVVYGNREEDPVFLNQALEVRYNSFDDKLYVVDFKDHQIKMFDTDLHYIDSYGRFGQGPGEFNSPFHIAFSRKGEIFIGDYGNGRIQVFDSLLQYRSTIRRQFKHMMCENFEVDSQGNVYVPGSDSKLFSVLDKSGNEIESFGDPLFSAGSGTDDSPLFERFKNSFLFAIDENDAIYCAFLYKPILRKYDKNHQLDYQIDLSDLESVRLFTKYLDKNDNQHKIINYVISITVDRKNVYLRLHYPDKEIHSPLFNSLFILDKMTGAAKERKDITANPKNEAEIVYYVDSRHPDYFYFIEAVSQTLVRARKYN